MEAIKNNQSRTTKQQRENGALFRDQLNNLFDVAHEEGLKIIKLQQEKDFVIAQHKPGKHGTMGRADKKKAR